MGKVVVLRLFEFFLNVISNQLGEDSNYSFINIIYKINDNCTT